MWPVSGHAGYSANAGEMENERGTCELYIVIPWHIAHDICMLVSINGEATVCIRSNYAEFGLLLYVLVKFKMANTYYLIFR